MPTFRPAANHFTAPKGQIFVRLMRHQDIFGTIDVRYAVRKLVIHCSRCDQPAVQLDQRWPQSSEFTRCKACKEV